MKDKKFKEKITQILCDITAYILNMGIPEDKGYQEEDLEELYNESQMLWKKVRGIKLGEEIE